MEDIKDELGAIFKAYGKATKDKVDKVDKTELLELLAYNSDQLIKALAWHNTHITYIIRMSFTRILS